MTEDILVGYRGAQLFCGIGLEILYATNTKNTRSTDISAISALTPL